MTSSDPPPGSATRRKLLGWSGVGAVGAVAAYLGWSRSSSSVRPRDSVMQSPPAKPAISSTPEEPLEQPAPAAAAAAFDREAFVPHLNSDFTVVQEGRDSGTCRLVEVGPASRIASRTQAYTCFTLVFEADFLFLREGGLCKVQHAQMPEMQLFLSPVGRPGRKVLLEAVFTQAI